MSSDIGQKEIKVQNKKGKNEKQTFKQKER